MDNIIYQILSAWNTLQEIFYKFCYEWGLSYSTATNIGLLIIGLTLFPFVISLLKHLGGILLLLKLTLIGFAIYIAVHFYY